MHTDEFEISLSRELNVCTNTIGRIRKTLSLMERKYGVSTDDFLAGRLKGESVEQPGAAEDFRVWRDTHASLLSWQELERGYGEQLRIMKI